MLLLLVTVLLNDSKNADFKKYADFNVDSLEGIITLITSQEMFTVDREDSSFQTWWSLMFRDRKPFHFKLYYCKIIV